MIALAAWLGRKTEFEVPCVLYEGLEKAQEKKFWTCSNTEVKTILSKDLLRPVSS